MTTLLMTTRLLDLHIIHATYALFAPTTSNSNRSLCYPIYSLCVFGVHSAQLLFCISYMPCCHDALACVFDVNPALCLVFGVFLLQQNPYCLI